MSPGSSSQGPIWSSEQDKHAGFPQASYITNGGSAPPGSGGEWGASECPAAQGGGHSASPFTWEISPMRAGPDPAGLLPGRELAQSRSPRNLDQRADALQPMAALDSSFVCVCSSRKRAEESRGATGLKCPAWGWGDIFPELRPSCPVTRLVPQASDSRWPPYPTPKHCPPAASLSQGQRLQGAARCSCTF